MLDGLRRFEDVLGNKKLLVEDDDVRNIFTLTGILESSAPPGKPARILFAENGYEALDVLGLKRRGFDSDGHHDARHGRLRDNPPPAAN